MANTYPDIAIRPDKAGYPLVSQQGNSIPTNDARNGAAFKAYLGQTPGSTPSTANSAATGKSSFKGFIKGLFDIVNPLQHIPIVSSIYRHITNDQISPAAHFAGDALYGGPIGGALAAADIAFEKKTGKNVGETVIASLTHSNKTTPPATNTAPDTMIAQNLGKVEPAAGGNKISPASNNIIWSDSNAANNTGDIIWTSASAMFPPSLPTGTSGREPASPSTIAQPALSAKGAVSTTVLQTQEAPAAAGRKLVPPELIASKMMEGLQKYATMKQALTVPTMSTLY